MIIPDPACVLAGDLQGVDVREIKVYHILPLIKMPGLVSVFWFSILGHLDEKSQHGKAPWGLLSLHSLAGFCLVQRHVFDQSCSPGAG